MRSLATILLLLVCAFSAHAQEQERKLMDRIERPNMERPFDLRQSSFGNKAMTTTKAGTKDFGGAKAFGAKEFTPKTFTPSKPSWLMGKLFSTKKASVQSKYEVPNAGNAVDTKTAAVKDARDGNKTMDTAAYASAERDYLRRGRSQDRFDSEKGVPKDGKPVGYTGSLQPMTIDDVRELLNKNK